MLTNNAKEIYTRHIEGLPPAERLQLLAMLAQGLASEAVPGPQPQRSIMELHGLGAHIWKGVDPQEYIDRLRDEWERPVSPDAHESL